ncbi:MAG TPA: nucleoside-diphosphate sugar epimerase/dehydratase [Syntrophales bacterium]|nr:nucleoside-diphosphate sugar epimerase/dehydratase [Syntrophales bacterium]HOL60159.1 nucleoside-diphosphate sugar epimerase/dehydratase [Syntrophales bacterium]HPO36272.1 nucleoside-diphosphate sugar epimerase/dehydratase [Syntrophales bacterium]
MNKKLKRTVTLAITVILDAVLLVGAHMGAYLIRFEGQISPFYLTFIQETLPWIVVIKIIFLAWTGLYRGIWRYTGVVDLQNIVKGTTLASVGMVIILILAYRFASFPRSVLILDWILSVFFIGGIRFAYRIYVNKELNIAFPWQAVKNPSPKRLLIIGAGAAGEKVIRELKENPSLDLEPIGFLDDSSEKHGKTIHGVRVLGGIDEIQEFTSFFDEILIAIPSAKGAQMRRIVEICESTGKKFRTLPSIGELINGRISVNAIREVSLVDLLGREEIVLDQKRIRQFIEGKRVLITGAGGSIGSDLVHQVMNFKPAAMGLLDFSEYNLYRIDLECRRENTGIEIHPFLSDIRQAETVERIFYIFKPHIVFHAAAYKHVPIQEMHPREAIYTNVLGTMNVADAAAQHGTDSFILVSTDKAVRPTNVMGATKRIAEMIIQSMNGKNGTRFMAVRFGNVIGSSGSVIPLFQEQIARGGPVTVTHPEITRFFMSIPEATQLILQAGSMGEGGEIFILDMGRPVRILDIARDLIRLNGLVPDKDIAIQFIGLRPGEKLYEELITEGEGISPTSHPKVFVLRGPAPDYATLSSLISDLLNTARTFDDDLLRTQIATLVPEYEITNHQPGKRIYG